jgi:hypothetical protein
MSWLLKKIFASSQAAPALVDTGKGNPVTATRSKISNIMKPINNSREKQNNRRSLVLSVIKKDIKEARRLLDVGLDANTTDGWGTPILMLVPRVNSMLNTRKNTEKDTMQVKCIEMLNLLLEKGANINKQDAYGLTTLYSIVVDNKLRKGDKLEYINILLDKGADPRIPCKSGSTVLDFWYLEDNTEYINEYIDFKNQVNLSSVKELLINKVFLKMIPEGTLPDKVGRKIREIETTIKEAIESKMEAAQRDTPNAVLKGLQIFNCWRDSDRIALQSAIHRSPLTKAQMTRTGNNAAVHPRPGNAAEANILRYEMSGEQVKGYQNEVNAEYELAQVNVNTAEGDFEKQKEILFPENPEVAKRIQNFQKQAAPGEGGRRRNRNRKTKKHSRKH